MQTLRTWWDPHYRSSPVCLCRCTSVWYWILRAFIRAVGVALKFGRYTISTLQASISVLLRHSLRNRKYSFKVIPKSLNLSAFLSYTFSHSFIFSHSSIFSHSFIFFWFHFFYHCMYGCMFCMLLFGVAVWSAEQTATIQSEKYQCRTDTVSSLDDGHIVARNMCRSWNKCTKK